ncbi:MAG: AAA family ATPase [Phocaeicola sp.]
MKPVLFILSGLPGSGKSTIAQFIAKKYGALYLRIDTIEQGLREFCHYEVEGEGYALAYKIAGDNLNLALNVVADSCNPIVYTRKQWEAVATGNGSIFINIEVVCSDKKVHRERIETRVAEVANLKLPTWEEVECREYHPWLEERILLDTANKSVEATLEDLDRKVSQFFKELYIKS